MPCKSFHLALRAGRGPAFTLVEVLLALTITAMVGASVAAMLAGTSYGTSSRRSMRGVLVKTQTTHSRLSAALRVAREVVHPNSGQPTSNDYLVLWIADANDDNIKQNNEVQLIERVAAQDELRSYTSDADPADFVDTSTFRTLALSSYTPELWATEVTALSSRATLSPAGTTLISFRLTVTHGDLTDTAVGASAVRQ